MFVRAKYELLLAGNTDLLDQIPEIITRAYFSFAFLHQLSRITFFVSLNITVFFDCAILLYSCLNLYFVAVNNLQKKIPDDKPHVGLFCHFGEMYVSRVRIEHCDWSKYREH